MNTTDTQPNASETTSQLDFWLPATWTSEASRISDLTNSSVTPSVTSSLASELGLPPSAMPIGLTIARSGPAHALANLSAAQAKAKGLLTSGTSGRHGSTSSSSASLQQSLANRLEARLACYGSTLYRLIWKRRATPSGWLISALRASGLRTSDNDCSGWPTPDASAMNVGANVEMHMQRMVRLKAKHGNGNGAGLTLGIVAQLAGWAKCRSEDAESSGVRWNRGKGVFDTLTAQAMLAGSGPMPTSSLAKMGSTARLSPEHSRWLMGLPPEWNASVNTGTGSSSRSRRSS